MMSREWERGRLARVAGLTRSDNPYRRHGRRAIRWLSGWLFQNERQQTAALEPCPKCGGKGWDTYDCDTSGPGFRPGTYVERCDDCERFADDDAALAHVEELARAADPVAVAALMGCGPWPTDEPPEPDPDRIQAEREDMDRIEREALAREPHRRGWE